MGHLLGGILANIGVGRLVGGYEVRQNVDGGFFGPTTGSTGWTGEWSGWRRKYRSVKSTLKVF
jgi:hypothetical protein